MQRHGVPWTYYRYVMGAVMKDNYVDVGWTFHLKRFIRWIVTAGPGRSATCALLYHMVCINIFLVKKKKVEALNVERVTKVTKAKHLTLNFTDTISYARIVHATVRLMRCCSDCDL